MFLCIFTEFYQYRVRSISGSRGVAPGAPPTTPPPPPQNLKNIGFKKRQNSPISFIDFKLFSAVQNIGYDSMKCTLYCPWFHIFFSVVLNRFKNRHNSPFTILVFHFFSAVPNTVRMHHLLSRVFFFSLQFQLFQISVKMHHGFTLLVFKKFSL